MPSRSVDPAQEPGPARDARAKEAAKATAAADRLLPGEDPDRADSTDAERWVDVYAELLTFKQGMLTQTSEHLGQMQHDEARLEVERTDAVQMRAEAERLAGRLGFWRRRLEELSAAE